MSKKSSIEEAILTNDDLKIFQEEREALIEEILEESGDPSDNTDKSDMIKEEEIHINPSEDSLKTSYISTHSSQNIPDFDKTSLKGFKSSLIKPVKL